MKQTYHVLWYDDNPEIIIDDVKPWLHRFLSERGFNCAFELHEEYSPQTPSFWARYDLIVTDLNLVHNGDGRRLIDEIRGGHILTDVLIYSANPEALEGAMKRNPFLERVSIQFGRSNLEHKLSEVIQLTIKKTQTISHIRGQFIAEAIDLENKLLEFLCDYLHPKFIPAISDKKLKSWSGFVDRKLRLLERQATKIKGYDHTSESLHSLKYFQSFDAYELSKDGLDDLKKHFEELSASGDAESLQRARLTAEIRQKLVDFNNEVIDVRNTLAHVKESPGKNGTILKSRKPDGGEIVITEDWCIATRLCLKAHHDNLEKMVRLLISCGPIKDA